MPKTDERDVGASADADRAVAVPAEPEVSVANQLAGYIGPDTAPELTAFLWRESKEAAKLARQVDAMRSRIERLEEGLVDKSVALALAAGKLTVALDGQERYRAHRQAVVDAMNELTDTLAALGDDG